MDDQDLESGRACLATPVARRGDALAAAIRSHREGRPADALARCTEILAVERTNVEAMHLLGLLHQQLGRPERAIEWIGRALELAPGSAAMHADLGKVLWDAGRRDESLARFRLAAEIDPDRLPNRTNLAAVLLTLGRADEALPHCEWAVRRSPGDARLREALGNALSLLGRLAEARAAFLAAIRLEPGLATAHYHGGLACLRGGWLADAERLAARAVELSPNQPSMWELLAEVRGALEKFDEAIPAWQRALSLAPDARARPHLALGWALQVEGRLDEAEHHYRAAAAIAPLSACPQIDLGFLHQDRGDFDAAEAAYRQAIRIEPSHPTPHARLAGLLGGKLPEADFERLRALLDDPATAGEPRTRLLFALGFVLDARGDLAGAARSLREANARQHASNVGPRRFRPATYERFVDNLIRTFDAGFFSRVAGAGLSSSQPVFLVGLPRSGTTLVEQILASHPRVHGAGELPLARRMYESLPSVLGVEASPTQCASRLDADAIGRLARSYLERLHGRTSGGADRIVDKMLDNTYYLGFLLALFPRARVIHCRRDIRDTAVSCWMSDFSDVFWANDPDHIAARFRGHLRLMEHWRSVLPTSIHEVAYEAVVDDLEGEACRLIDALGLPWDPSCLDFHRTNRPVRTTSFAQVRQPIYRRSVARWERYRHEMADLFAALPQAG